MGYHNPEIWSFRRWPANWFADRRRRNRLSVLFTDPMTLQPHDTDVKALTRLAGVENIVFCCNRSTADHIITSPLFTDPTYERIHPDYTNYTQRFENKGIISEAVEQVKKRRNKSENNISKWTVISSSIFIRLSKKQVVYIFQNWYLLNGNLLPPTRRVGGKKPLIKYFASFMHPSRKRTRALRVYITPFTFLFSPSSKVLLPVFSGTTLWEIMRKSPFCARIHPQDPMPKGHGTCR